MRTLGLIVATIGALVLGSMEAHAQRLPVPGCRIGEEFSLKGIDALFRVDTLTVNKSARALEFMDKDVPSGDYIMPMYNALLKGDGISRYTGPDATITLSILGLNAPMMPAEIPYLSGLGPRGNGLCRGYAHVTQVANNEIHVSAPLRAGDHLGQLSFLIPNAVMKGYPKALVCVTWNMNVHAPKLDIGPRKGWPNTSCGLPGNWPGHTRVGEAIANGQKWILFGAVVVTNNQTPGPVFVPQRVY